MPAWEVLHGARVVVVAQAARARSFALSAGTAAQDLEESAVALMGRQNAGLVEYVILCMIPCERNHSEIAPFSSCACVCHDRNGRSCSHTRLGTSPWDENNNECIDQRSDRLIPLKEIHCGLFLKAHCLLMLK
jgi:hypothetical protein